VKNFLFKVTNIASSAESVGENTKPYTFKHYRKGFFLENRPDFSQYDIWINET